MRTSSKELRGALAVSCTRGVCLFGRLLDNPRTFGGSFTRHLPPDGWNRLRLPSSPNPMRAPRRSGLELATSSRARAGTAESFTYLVIRLGRLSHYQVLP